MIRTLVERFYDEIWNQQDFSKIDEMLVDDFIFRGSLGPEMVGRDAFIAYARRVTAALSDYRCDIDTLVVEDDRAFAKMWFGGRHTGEMLGVAATGKTIGWAGAALFEARGGRIAATWVLGDVAGLEQALADASRDSS